MEEGSASDAERWIKGGRKKGGKKGTILQDLGYTSAQGQGTVERRLLPNRGQHKGRNPTL